MKHRKAFDLRLFIGFLSIISTATMANAADRPNILFLFADDQRADTISAYGNPHIKTPNLDKLVASGFSFRGNYIFGGNSGAVCMPSRAMLMTGKTWFKMDTATLKNEVLLPELLQKNGYVTFGTGKWHNGQPSWLRAFQQGKNIFFSGMSDHTQVPVKDLGPDGNLTPQRIGEKISSELFADSIIDFLKCHDGTKPFFAYAAFTAPHDPRMPPLSYREYYYRKLPPLPANYLPQLPFDNGMMKGGRDENLAQWPRTQSIIRDQLAEYYGLITHLDEQIGRVVATLQESKFAKNTLIIYAADNGLALGSHGLLGKQSVFEHSMRVPLIFSGQGIPKGKSTRAFTYLLDIFPTLCDLLEIPASIPFEGQSLRPLWEGKTQQIRDSVFLPFLNIQRAIRDDRWKLICYPKIGYMQLFDLKSDPDETNNLIDKPKHEETVGRLLSRMKQWQTKVGDTLELPSKSKSPPAINLTGRARLPDQWQPDWIVDKYFKDSLIGESRKIRPDLLLGSFSSGLDSGTNRNPVLADFFRRNFNIMTVGIYMTSTQPNREGFNLDRTDALIKYAQENNLKVYLHPMLGGVEYTPKWVNEGNLSKEQLNQLMRDRITTILSRYKGKIHYVDVVNEALTGKGRKADGQFDWQEKAYRGGDHVWLKTLGMHQGKKFQFPRYLVDSFRLAREVGGPDLKLILNEWGNETTNGMRSGAFLELIQALREEGIPVDGAGLQLHCRMKQGILQGWADNRPFDFDAFDAMLNLYEKAGIEVHITEFDIHLEPKPTEDDFELQGKYYAEILRRALKSPAVKSFKTWGFTDRHSWKADGVDGHPLLLDNNFQPKPAYIRQLDMLRGMSLESSRIRPN